jgi:tetratricopeptide (TPR) repeat protein
MGYCYISMEKQKMAAQEFKTAVDLQPNYVIAWNNLGDVREKMRDWKGALTAYEEAVALSPDDETASSRAKQLKLRVNRISAGSSM